MLVSQGQKFEDGFLNLKLKKDKFFLPLVKSLPSFIVPNHVTLFRFIITLIWIPLAILKPSLSHVFIFFIPVVLLDMLDGAIARTNN